MIGNWGVFCWMQGIAAFGRKFSGLDPSMNFGCSARSQVAVCDKGRLAHKIALTTFHLAIFLVGSTVDSSAQNYRLLTTETKAGVIHRFRIPERLLDEVHLAPNGKSVAIWSIRTTVAELERYAGQPPGSGSDLEPGGTKIVFQLIAPHNQWPSEHPYRIWDAAAQSRLHALGIILGSTQGLTKLDYDRLVANGFHTPTRLVLRGQATPVLVSADPSPNLLTKYVSITCFKQPARDCHLVATLEDFIYGVHFSDLDLRKWQRIVSGIERTYRELKLR